MADGLDNCTLVPNPDQLDTDVDGFGNVCDADLDNSGTVTATDFSLLLSVLGQSAAFSPLAAAADLDGNGVVNINDLSRAKIFLGKSPGPAGYPAPQIDNIPDTANSAYTFEVSVPLSIRAADGDLVTVSASVADATVVDAIVDASWRTLRLRPKARGHSMVTVEARGANNSTSVSFEFTVQDVTRIAQVTSQAPATEAVVLINTSTAATTFDLTHNGHLAFSSMTQILDAVRSLPDEINAEPLERKIWRFVRDNTLHFPAVNFQQWNLASWPTLNSFGFGLCSNLDSVFVQIAQAAGYEAHVRSVTGHVTAEIQVNGSWKMYDPDLAVYYYKRDGIVANVDDLIADPTLISSPANPIFSAGTNDVVYSQSMAERYGSTNYYLTLSYLPADSFLGTHITLPAGGRLIYPGVWTAPPVGLDDAATQYPVEQFRQARLELPAGHTGVVGIPWVLWDVQGSGSVRISGQDFTAGSGELRAFLINPVNPITELEVIDDPSGLALIMMINPLWYDMHEDNDLALTGKDVWAIEGGTYPLDPANRPPPPVPASMRKPRP